MFTVVDFPAIWGLPHSAQSYTVAYLPDPFCVAETLTIGRNAAIRVAGSLQFINRLGATLRPVPSTKKRHEMPSRKTLFSDIIFNFFSARLQKRVPKRLERYKLSEDNVSTRIAYY